MKKQKAKKSVSVIEELLKPLDNLKDLREYIYLLEQVLNDISINEYDNYTIEDFSQECLIALYLITKNTQKKESIEKQFLMATRKILNNMKTEQQFFDKIPHDIDPDQSKELDDALSNLYIEQIKNSLPQKESELLDQLYVKSKSIKEATETLNLTVHKTNYLKENILKYVKDSIEKDSILLNEYQKLMLKLYKEYFKSSDNNYSPLIDFFQISSHTFYKSYYLFEYKSLSFFLQWAKRKIASTPKYCRYSLFIFNDCLKYQECYNEFHENPSKYKNQYRQEIYKRSFLKKSE